MNKPAMQLDEVMTLAEGKLPGWALAVLKSQMRGINDSKTNPDLGNVFAQAPVAQADVPVLKVAPDGEAPPKRGLMVALMLPADVAKKLAQEGGEPPEKMHCTLAYPGKVEDLPADAIDRVKRAVEKACAEFAPFVAMIGGVGRFNASHTSDGKDVLHATLDAPVLPALQQAIARALDDEKVPPKREHGFDPHITLSYQERSSGAALPDLPTLPVIFSSVAVVAGDERVAEIPLAGTRVFKALSDEELEDVERETEEIRRNREGKEAQRQHDFKPAKWTHKNGHPRCFVCGQEEPVGGMCAARVAKGQPSAGDAHAPEALASVRDRLDELEKAGLSRPAAHARVRDELKGTGVTREQATELVEKARPLSREYLEEAWTEARKLLPKWAWSMIHEQAMPRSGSRARAERDDSPGAFDRVALSNIAGSQLAKLSDEDLSQMWKRMGLWHSAAKRRRRDVAEIVGAAAYVSDEMTKRGLDCASPMLEDVQQSRGSLVTKEKPVGKGLPNEVPEIGIHLHNLEREASRTKSDGLHAHLFVFPDGSEVWSEEDGAHVHALSSPDAALIPPEPTAGGLHTHRVMLPDELAETLGVRELVTQEDGLHGHQLQVWSTAFDGAHVHELKLPDGSSVRNLTPGQYWEREGKPPMAELPPAPPASELAQLDKEEGDEPIEKKEPPLKVDVPTVGPDNADVMFIGASPSRPEAARKEPFVGAAGETLNDTYLAPLGVKRSQVAMSNAVPLLLRDADGKAREPSPDEVHSWSNWLGAEIARIKPRTLIALGRTAEAAIDLAIGRRADLTLPHPTAVRRFGNSGEVARKLKRAKDLLAERKSKNEHVTPARVAKAALDEGSDGGENAVAYWDKHWHEALPKSGKGRFVYQHHWRGLDEDEAAKMSDEQLMRQGAHSVHGDLRLEGEGGKLWGWAVLIGDAEGNADLPHNDKLIDLPKGEKLGLAPKLAHPKEWLDVGVDKPLVTEPGEVGATSQKAAKLFALDQGTYELGVGRQHAQEIFLDGKLLRGRYLLQFAPVAGRRRWLIDKPEDQTPMAEGRDLADLTGELKRKKQRYLVWSKPGETPQKIDVLAGKVIKSAIIPLLKERALEDKRIVYGVVLDPYIVDAHQDWVPPDVIEETAHRWFKGSRMITLHHKTHADARAIESSLVEYPSQHDYAAARLNEPHRVLRRKFGDDVVHSGSWIIGVELTPELWEAYKRDEIAAFSIEGFGMRTPTTKKAMPNVTYVDVVEVKAGSRR